MRRRLQSSRQESGLSARLAGGTKIIGRITNLGLCCADQGGHTRVPRLTDSMRSTSRMRRERYLWYARLGACACSPVTRTWDSEQEQVVLRSPRRPLGDRYSTSLQGTHTCTDPGHGGCTARGAPGPVSSVCMRQGRAIGGDAHRGPRCVTQVSKISLSGTCTPRLAKVFRRGVIWQWQALHGRTGGLSRLVAHIPDSMAGVWIQSCAPMCTARAHACKSSVTAVSTASALRGLSKVEPHRTLRAALYRRLEAGAS
ncbi:hypothetical protein K466DRAFT_112681 [Polyporus arcularius HHB13444]|uniref:Uncharacterized protein n=1 Tax=Polyporus arcularius HHB13444 TaxID=1314778 RepID=A0A5C3PCG1_9APHY|nr:hypothetical protein K466DRAFT_112681 [Polyporus arcularius HHB13444]